MTTPTPTAAEALRYRDERDELRSRYSEAAVDRQTLAAENGALRDEVADLREQITRLVVERDAARRDRADILALVDAAAP